MNRPNRIRAAVEAASILELAAAMIEPDAFGDMPLWTAELFPCPYCQASPRRWMETGPAARLLGDILWDCSLCGVVGTRFRLGYSVLQDAGALRRFLARADVAA